jgi:hypothetical protein
VDPEEAVDNDDVADANTYEELSRTQDPPASNTIAPLPSADIPPSFSPSEQPNVSDHADYGIAAGCETAALIVDSFSSGGAGAPITDSSPGHESAHDPTREPPHHSIWAPFRSQCDWEIARWAKLRGSTSSAVTELLAIPGVRVSDILLFQTTYTLYKVVEKLELSYHNVRELNKIIDEELPGRPMFRCEAVEIDGQILELHYREIIPCIRSLYGDPELVNDLIFAPERHYTDAGRTSRVFSEIHTGNWWWSVQVRDMVKSNTGGMLTTVPDVFGTAETWRDSDPHHSILRQNTVDPFSGQVSISGVPHYRKYTERHSS